MTVYFSVLDIFLKDVNAILLHLYLACQPVWRISLTLYCRHHDEASLRTGPGSSLQTSCMKFFFFFNSIEWWIHLYILHTEENTCFINANCWANNADLNIWEEWFKLLSCSQIFEEWMLILTFSEILSCWKWYTSHTPWFLIFFFLILKPCHFFPFGW